MNPLLEKNKAALQALCKKHHVLRLGVFGSALREDFNPVMSDLDILVEFQSLTPVEHADAYFNLMDDLHSLLGLPIDLVERKPIKNPFFLEAIDQSRVLLYEAA